ncbi:MAG: hypothetical protein ACOCWY_01650 [Thermodesulfobacteriota bacterium]
MKIELSDIIQKNNDVWVSFQCEIGKAVAKWHGGIPVKNNEYVVELDFEDDLVFGENLFYTDKQTYNIFKRDDNITLIGVITNIFDDQTASFDLKQDSILIDYEGKLKEGEWIRIEVSQLDVYDTNI